MAFFCYWDAKSKEDLIIIIVNQIITSTIGITALIRIPGILLQYRQQSRRIKTLLLIHILVLLWSITQTIVNFYSIIIFTFKLRPEQTSQDMMSYSHNFAIICSFPGFIVQTLFITICYKYCSNILKQQDVSRYSKHSFKFKKTLFLYCFIRLFLRISIIILISVSENQDFGAYSQIQFIQLIIDSGIINIFLVTFAFMFIKRLQSQRLSQLKLEYWMMASCSFSRIVIDLVFLLVINTHSDENYQCVGDFNSHITYSILYNLFGNIIMHFIPITIILKIYNYNPQQQYRNMLLVQSIYSKESQQMTQITRTE